MIKWDVIRTIIIIIFTITIINLGRADWAVTTTTITITIIITTTNTIIITTTITVTTCTTNWWPNWAIDTWSWLNLVTPSPADDQTVPPPSPADDQTMSPPSPADDHRRSVMTSLAMTIPNSWRPNCAATITSWWPPNQATTIIITLGFPPQGQDSRGRGAHCREAPTFCNPLRWQQWHRGPPQPLYRGHHKHPTNITQTGDFCENIGIYLKRLIMDDFTVPPHIFISYFISQY